LPGKKAYKANTGSSFSTMGIRGLSPEKGGFHQIERGGEKLEEKSGGIRKKKSQKKKKSETFGRLPGGANIIVFDGGESPNGGACETVKKVQKGKLRRGDGYLFFHGEKGSSRDFKDLAVE